jgi:DNA-binding CsgD family transcriptional regulator
MTGSANMPRSRPEVSGRSEQSSHGRVPGSIARILVGKRAFCVVPLASLNGQDRNGIAPPGEEARFDLCGRTFLVVEEPAASGNGHGDDDVVARLTERELQIAILVALGNPTKCIAYKLGITEWTVKEYLRRIFAKLRVRSQAAMVYRCAHLLQRLDSEGRLSGAGGNRAGERPAESL